MSLDKPIDNFIEDQKNKNALSKTRRDVSLLTEFLNSKNESFFRYFRYFYIASFVIFKRAVPYLIKN